VQEMHQCRQAVATAPNASQDIIRTGQTAIEVRPERRGPPMLQFNAQPRQRSQQLSLPARRRISASITFFTKGYQIPPSTDSLLGKLIVPRA